MQLAGLDADLRQLVAIDNLTTHEYGLYSRNRAVDALLHQTDVGGNQILRNQACNNIRQFDVKVDHGFVVLETKAQSRYLWEELGKRLALHLLRLLDGIAGVYGQLFELVEGIGLLGCG